MKWSSQVVQGRRLSMLLAAAATCASTPVLGQNTTTLYLVKSQSLDALCQPELSPGVPQDDNRLWVGHRPGAVAFGRNRLFIAGEAAAGPLPRDGDDADGDNNRLELTPFNVAIVEIDNFLTTPVFNRIPGSRRSVGVSQGYTGLDYAPNQGLTVRGLVASYDAGGGGPNLITRYNVDGPGDGVLVAPMPPLLTGFRLGGSGLAWDFGPTGNGLDFLPPGAPDGVSDGGVIATLLENEFGPFGLNPGTLNAGLGVTAYEVNVNNGPRLAPADELARDWRDVAIDPRNGKLAARASNTVILATRNAIGTATRVDLSPLDPISERLTPAALSTTSCQRIAILSGYDDAGIGDLIVWNDRPNTAPGQTFAACVRFNKTDRGTPADSGATVTVSVRLPDNSPATFPSGDGAYDFHWDPESALLIVADLANRTVHALSRQRPVACCLPTGSCVLLNPSACLATGVGGSPGVDGSTCSPNPCPQPTIACCFSNGTCLLLTPTPCADSGGVVQALGITCSPNPCSVISGACCTGTACSVVAATACGGAFRGGGTTCQFAGNPITCCPANHNQLGGLSVQDVFDYLNDYFIGHPDADFNGINGVSVQDIFDYLFAYFQGCPG